jgi:quinol monooxygenase YgiN
MVVVTVTFTVSSPHAEAFRRAVTAQARNSLTRETGCRRFDVSVDPKNPDRFFLYEIYADNGSFDAHRQTDHYHQFSTTVSDWVVDKSIATWQLVPA